jgi:hypothetical protein
MGTIALISLPQVFSPANIIFAGIGILFQVCIFHNFPYVAILTCFQAAKDASASQDKLIDLFSRIECFFLRLEIYTTVPPSTAMTSIIVDIICRGTNDPRDCDEGNETWTIE